MSDRVPVCIFAKPPLPGLVKTRLAARLGEQRAAQLARAFFQDTWACVQSLPWARPILAGTSLDVTSFGLEGEVEVWLQGEGSLGARLEKIAARGLAEASRVLLIGADLPGLPAPHLDVALAGLDHDEVVLSPSADGGFYLLGATRLRAGALEAITWSTPTTCAQTRAALLASGHSVGAGPGWFDVDEVEDLDRLRAHLRTHPDAAPRTRSLLEGRP